MILTRDKGQRMWGGNGGTSIGFGGSSSGGSGGGVSIPYYNQNFELLYKKVVTDGTTGTVTTQYLTAQPNEIVNVGTETDPTTGDVTVTTIVGPKVKTALVIGDAMLVWDAQNSAVYVINRDGTTAANLYATGGVSALGYSPGGGGGGGVSSLTDLLDVALSNPSNGQALVYDTSLSPAKWVNKTIFESMTYGSNVLSLTISGVTRNVTIQTGTSSVDWANITNKPATATRWPTFAEVTSKPTTLGDYGITDAYISNGTIVLGGNSITPVTSLYGYATQDWANGRFLPLAGGTMTGQISGGLSGIWVKGRENALVKQTAGNGIGWAPVLSVKTYSGSYELGAISDSTNVRDKLILTFVTDSDYNNNVNNCTSIYFPTSEGTLALTSDITSAISSAISDMATKTWANGRFLPLAGGTMTGSLTMKGHDIVLGTPGTSSDDSADIDWMYGNGNEKARIWVADVFTELHGPYYRAFDANGQQIGNTTMLALLTDNVASATKLLTARNLWGNSFDGTADIGTSNSNASLNYVADINMSGNLTCQNVFANENVRLLESGNCWWILGYQAGSSNNSFNILRYDIGQSSITIPLSINKTDSSISMAGSLYVGSNIQESGNFFLMNYASYGLMIEGYAISGTVRRSSFGLHTASGIIWSQLSGTDDIIMQLITDTNRTFAKKYAQFYDGIRIGDGMIVWDSTNNAFQIIKSDGTAANLYTTGGVSALGMSAGVSSIDAMTFGNLTVNNNLKITKGDYSHNIYGDANGSLHLDGSEYVVMGNDVLTEGYSIYCGEGSVTAKRFYLDSSRYLYLDSSNVLRYYDNGTSRIIAFS